MLEKRIGTRSSQDMVVLDGLDPWKVLGYLENAEASDLGRQLSLQMHPNLQGFAQNPIIVPRYQHSWECFTTFNPAAFFLDEQVHILYRAQGHDYTSSLGYAVSNDGYTVSERLAEPVYVEKKSPAPGSLRNPLPYGSGGSFGGVEDPRATVLEEQVHVTYVSYDGYTPPRLAYTAINSDDFLRRDWRWQPSQYISQPGVIDKSGAIFPGEGP